MVLEVVGLVVGVMVMDHLDGWGVQTHLPVLDPMVAIFPLGEMMAAIFPLQQQEHPPQQQHLAPPTDTAGVSGSCTALVGARPKRARASSAA